MERRRGKPVSEFAFADGAPTPRKRPRQDRSRETVAAILTATIRVLDEHGEITTTRVAQVAGVSVGTLYQYFPNRDALLTGVLADHLEGAISAVEHAVEITAGTPRRERIERVVRAFLAEKAHRVATSHLLNRVFGVGMLDDRPVVRAAALRAQRAVARLIADPPDEPALQRAGIACSALEGVVRAAIAEDPERLRDPAWADQVIAMTVASWS